MKEIYWIQRLDNFYDCFIAILMCAIIATIMLSVVKLASEANEEKARIKKAKRWLVCSVTIGIFSAIGLVFMPTTEEALTILGVGGTIEYVKKSDTLKELPEKCEKALDVWLDSLIESKDENLH